MKKLGNGSKVWTAGLSVFVAAMLFPNIVGKHGVGKSVLITTLAVAAIWLMYFVIGRIVGWAVAEELKRKELKPPQRDAGEPDQEKEDSR